PYDIVCVSSARLGLWGPAAWHHGRQQWPVLTGLGGDRTLVMKAPPTCLLHLRSGPALDMPAAVNLLVPLEILIQSAGCHVFDFKFFRQVIIQFEFPEVVGEDQQAIAG